ncbi:MAG: response regulator transcription factor [Clostridiales bacterium]|nr:response regulator transcription factor [Clostridiales bacterium]MCD7828655.1 response regulator transcription factor [Clostridiales bacterium]
MLRIMIVDDNANTRKLTEAVLKQHNYDTVCACDGLDALDKLDNIHVDLIILDVMMPGMDGFEFTRTLRSCGWEIPILMVTAKESHLDKKEGFLAGTDDYMVKPVDDEEMLLRIAALLRRSKIAGEHKITVGNTVLDHDSMTVTTPDGTVELPQKEFMLLFQLLSYKDKIFTRRQLMDELWDMNSDTDERTVDVHINRLRDKFKNNDDFQIVTIRGLGYKAVCK